MIPRRRKVGRGNVLHQLVDAEAGIGEQREAAATTVSVRLCGGMFVAMPTAMPDEPFTSRFGSFDGSTDGSCSLSS